MGGTGLFLPGYQAHAAAPTPTVLPQSEPLLRTKGLSRSFRIYPTYPYLQNTQWARMRQQRHRPPKTHKVGTNSVVPRERERERERERFSQVSCECTRTTPVHTRDTPQSSPGPGGRVPGRRPAVPEAVSPGHPCGHRRRTHRHERPPRPDGAQRLAPPPPPGVLHSAAADQPYPPQGHPRCHVKSMPHGRQLLDTPAVAPPGRPLEPPELGDVGDVGVDERAPPAVWAAAEQPLEPPELVFGAHERAPPAVRAAAERPLDAQELVLGGQHPCPQCPQRALPVHAATERPLDPQLRLECPVPGQQEGLVPVCLLTKGKAWQICCCRLLSVRQTACFPGHRRLAAGRQHSGARLYPEPFSRRLETPALVPPSLALPCTTAHCSHTAVIHHCSVYVLSVPYVQVFSSTPCPVPARVSQSSATGSRVVVVFLGFTSLIAWSTPIVQSIFMRIHLHYDAAGKDRDRRPLTTDTTVFGALHPDGLFFARPVNGALFDAEGSWEGAYTTSSLTPPPISRTGGAGRCREMPWPIASGRPCYDPKERTSSGTTPRR